MTSESPIRSPSRASPRRKRSLSTEDPDHLEEDSGRQFKKQALDEVPSEMTEPFAVDAPADNFMETNSSELPPRSTRSQSRSRSRSLSPHPRRRSSPPNSNDNADANVEHPKELHEEHRSNTSGDNRARDRDTDRPANSINVRSLVTTKDAGVIIGKGGVHVKAMREESGAKITVSELVEGCSERILNVAGPVDVVAKAFNLISRRLIEEQQNRQRRSDNPAVDFPSPSQSPTSIRLLVPNVRMGMIIGRSGTKIKEIQELSNARVVASAEALPNSTDRTINITGVPDAIHIAIYHITRILVANEDKPYSSVPYKPSRLLANAQSSMMRYPMSHAGGPQQRQTMFIPGNIVGAVIGKAGTKINEIRLQSGCSIRISETPGTSGERAVDIVGNAEACSNAVYLLHKRIEYETKRIQQNAERR